MLKYVGGACGVLFLSRSVFSRFRVLVLGVYYGFMGTVIFIKVQIVTGCFAVANGKEQTSDKSSL